MKLNKELIDFLDTVRPVDNFTAIDYITPLITKYGMSKELAEQIRHAYVCEVFKKIGKEDGFKRRPVKIGD